MEVLKSFCLRKALGCSFPGMLSMRFTRTRKAKFFFAFAADSHSNVRHVHLEKDQKTGLVVSLLLRATHCQNGVCPVGCLETRRSDCLKVPTRTERAKARQHYSIFHDGDMPRTGPARHWARMAKGPARQTSTSNLLSQ